ncbi:RNA polymerase sigma factor, sigma-70 family [Sulfobacillus thermosulfidooxidans DSM 9293]|uniref:RNA polymerase sigma factor, sigma-70 family n=1 Tax=Sulfobacillus thermosulfidooxidans (strain DSM 9293 / VKM B-1269 / AT-1) TaxID=929705 RepID=A0A1W1WPI0_SULTA|nr:sigma factor [Sulfobacillus thermosulfidooxidans]SMC08136.1 RNA polymerase sigma factor, sigma-70 family [Sulfobacillus thermosulfidooxidans DSM 9293]
MTRWAFWTLNRLAHRARSDPDAFTALFARFRGWLRHEATRYTLPGLTSDDLYQEASLAFWIAVQTYQPHYHRVFSAWARHVVKHRLATAARMASRLKHRPLNTAASLNAPLYPHHDRQLADSLVDPGHNPSDTWETQELWAELVQQAANLGFL